ncbi:hypothetical protein JZY06_06610, partial [Corynebacterium sp. CCM 8862]
TSRVGSPLRVDSDVTLYAKWVKEKGDIDSQPSREDESHTYSTSRRSDVTSFAQGSIGSSGILLPVSVGLVLIGFVVAVLNPISMGFFNLQSMTAWNLLNSTGGKLVRVAAGLDK